MVSLLSQILNRLDNDPVKVLPQPGQISFVPDPSAVRINSFWLISLVLSLATALVGIVSLQWLREHQSYSDYTSEEAFAIFNMRAEALERWHVPKVFTAFPLLLQGALVLFLAGMVDFSLQLGDKVAIPVLIAIGLTLLFLLMTTTLPSLQGLSFYLRFPQTNDPTYLPSQCPYKSPQSKALQGVCQFAFHAAYYLRWHPKLTKPFHTAYCLCLRAFHFSPSPRREPKWESPTSHIYYTWIQRTWQQYDLQWLMLRNAFSQETFDRIHGLSVRSEPYFLSQPYLSDILAALRRVSTSTSIQDTSLAAAYHLFCALSVSTENILIHRPSVNEYTFFTDFHNRHRRYLHSLLAKRDDSLQSPPLFDFLDAFSYNQQDDNTMGCYSMLFHHQNIATFFEDSSRLRHHVRELHIRMEGWLYGTHHQINSTFAPLNISEADGVPICTWSTLDNGYYLAQSTRHDSEALYASKGIFFGKVLRVYIRLLILFLFPSELLRQYGSVFVKYFECVAENPLHDWSLDIHATSIIPELLEEASRTEYIDEISSTCIPITSIIVERLNKSLDLPHEDSGNTNYNLLFYAAVLYLYFFPRDLPRNDERVWIIYRKLDEVRTVLCRYKVEILDIQGRDTFLEERFKGTDFILTDDDSAGRFSARWWTFLRVPFTKGTFNMMDDGNISTKI